MKKLLIIAGAIAFFLLTFWIFWAFLVFNLASTLDVPEKIAAFGQWGDTFGALNALFGALGFSVVAATLYLQQKQNDNNELEQHRQRFDATFFEILKLLRETRSEVEFRYSADYQYAHQTATSEKLIGTAAFKAAWNEYVHWYQLMKNTGRASAAGNLYYEKVHRRYESNFGPYYRLLYNTMRRIKDDQILNENEKIIYARLLRGQLNSYETALAGLSGLTKVSKDFSELIVEFRLLKYLPPRSRRRKILRKYYPVSCFSARPTKSISLYLHGLSQ